MYCINGIIKFDCTLLIIIYLNVYFFDKWLQFLITLQNYFQNHFYKNLHNYKYKYFIYFIFFVDKKICLKLSDITVLCNFHFYRGHRSLSLPPSLSQEIRKYKPLLQPVWSVVSSFDHDLLSYDVCTIVTILNFIHIDEVCVNFKRKERKKTFLHVRQLRCSGFYYFVTVSESALSVYIL